MYLNVATDNYYQKIMQKFEMEIIFILSSFSIHGSSVACTCVHVWSTVLIPMERMIQFTVRNKLFADSHNVYVWSDWWPLPENCTFFFQNRIYFFLHTLYYIICTCISMHFFPCRVQVCPALAMGNTVVLKPASYTRLTALLFAEICAEAGLPPG